jgi:hypothetical protein
MALDGNPQGSTPAPKRQSKKGTLGGKKMKHIIYCIATLNSILSERTFGRALTPPEIIGIAQIKAAIILLQQARGSFGISDAISDAILGVEQTETTARWSRQNEAWDATIKKQK